MINELFNVTALDSKAGSTGKFTGGWRAVGTFGVTNAVNEASAFNMGFDPIDNRGLIYQGFDCYGRVHGVGLSSTDNINSSSRLNITFDSSTGIGKLDKKIDFEDGINSLGDIEINGVTAISEVKSGSFSFQDDANHTETFDYPLSVNFFEVRIHASTATKDSYMIMRVMKQGSSVVAEIGEVYGNELPVYAQYDVVESANNQKHCVKFLGFGSGDSVSYSFKSVKPLNNLQGI